MQYFVTSLRRHAAMNILLTLGVLLGIGMALTAALPTPEEITKDNEKVVINKVDKDGNGYQGVHYYGPGGHGSGSFTNAYVNKTFSYGSNGGSYSGYYNNKHGNHNHNNRDKDGDRKKDKDDRKDKDDDRKDKDDDRKKDKDRESHNNRDKDDDRKHGNRDNDKNRRPYGGHKTIKINAGGKEINKEISY